MSAFNGESRGHSDVVPMFADDRKRWWEVALFPRLCAKVD